MAYRIPDDELLVDAIVNVLLKNKTVVSQREICQLVVEQLNRNAEIPYRVSGNRVRRLSLERGLVSLDIEYRETHGIDLPEECPVCGRALDPVTNSTLEGGTAVVMMKCRSCGYVASARSSIPSKYTFNMRPRRVSEIHSVRMDRLYRAKEHIGIACDILESLIDGHVLAHDARNTISKLREICDGKEDPGSIGNMIRAMEVDEGEPGWCRPLASVKHVQRKDI